MLLKNSRTGPDSGPSKFSLPPFVRACEIVAGVTREHAPVRTEVVVDHVEDDWAEFVSGVDERTEVVGRAVETRRRKRNTPSYPQPKRPGNSAGHRSTIVIPVRASSGSFVAALAQVPSGVNVPTCISEITCPRIETPSDGADFRRSARHNPASAERSVGLIA